MKAAVIPAQCSSPDIAKGEVAAARGGRALAVNDVREKLVKIGAKVVRHGRYVTFQLAEVTGPRELFGKILSPIVDLRPRPAPA
jgi:hypothetical protein